MSAIGAILLRLWDSSVFRAIVVLLVALALGWGLYRLGKSKGAKLAHAEDAVAYQQAMDAANAKYREQEQANAKKVSDLRVEYANREAAAHAADTGMVRDLATGTRRVRIPVASCRPSTTQAPGSPARVDGPQDAELPPATAAALYAIAADGDTAIRQLTALQAWARSAVVLCGGGR